MCILQVNYLVNILVESVKESGCVSKCNPIATVSVGFVLVCSGEVENAKVWKPMYGNGVMETEVSSASLTHDGALKPMGDCLQAM